MTKTGYTDDDLLMAYADGRLDPEAAAAVERRLETDPEARRQVEEIRAQNDALRRRYAHVAEEDVPARLLAAAAAPAPRRWTARLAPLAASLALGVGAGWTANSAVTFAANDDADLSRRTLAAFDVYAVDQRRPVEISAENAEEMTRWFSNRLDMRFALPRLSDLGFEPIGGRLMIGATGPAALLMYEDADGERLVVYVRNDMPAQPAKGLAFSERGGVEAAYWSEGTRGVGVSGRFDREAISAVAQSVRLQLTES